MFDTQEEQQICRSLMTWIDDDSVVYDKLFIELHDTLIDKYYHVFKEIFIKTGHEAHYNMMMNIL